MKIWGLIFFWDSKFCFGNCCTTKIPYIKNFRVIQYFLYISPHWKMLKCSDFNILHWSQNSYVLAIPRLFNPWHFRLLFKFANKLRKHHTQPLYFSDQRTGPQWIKMNCYRHWWQIQKYSFILFQFDFLFTTNTASFVVFQG